MRVEAIYTATGHRAEPARNTEALAVAGKGLDGDRYFYEDRKAEVSLIEAEAIESVSEALGLAVALHQPRRNIVTRGVDLNGLVGRRFRIGAAEFQGTKLDHPCELMEKVIAPGARRAMKNRGGLYAAIVVSGVVREGDDVVVLDSESASTA